MTNRPPLVGYNTNVKHDGTVFHIQTEDSGVEHPHIITHLFVEGTILATKKCSYRDVLTEDGWENHVREMMKEQHKAMFIELRDGVHDEIAARIFGKTPAEESDKEVDDVPIDSKIEGPGVYHSVIPPSADGSASNDAVRVIHPAEMHKQRRTAQEKTTASSEADEAVAEVTPKNVRQRSIFDTPEDNGEFGENLITDKSLDEVILSYLTDELEE